MVTFTINIPPMLAYIPYMDPMGNILRARWNNETCPVLPPKGTYQGLRKSQDHYRSLSSNWTSQRLIHFWTYKIGNSKHPVWYPMRSPRSPPIPRIAPWWSGSPSPGSSQRAHSPPEWWPKSGHHRMVEVPVVTMNFKISMMIKVSN